MTVKQGPYIFIDRNNLAEADFISRNFVNKEIRNRAFINTLGAEALIKYLTTENVNLKNVRNIHSVARILEYVDIADIMMPNIHIDVRVVFDENQIFIPKSHFEYEIQPDIYVVLKLGTNFEYFELMGFFEPRSLNMSHENSQYYFYENYKLSSPGHLVKFIKTYARRAPESISEEELLRGRELSVNLADHDITENEFKTLLQLMASSSELRDSILEYDNFETLSHRVAPILGDDVTSSARPIQEVSVEPVLKDLYDEESTVEDDFLQQDETEEQTDEGESGDEGVNEETTADDETEEETEDIVQDEVNIEDINAEDFGDADVEEIVQNDADIENEVEQETQEEATADEDIETIAAEEVEEVKTAEELFGQDLTFDNENLSDNLSDTEEISDISTQAEEIEIADAEEEDEDTENNQEIESLENAVQDDSEQDESEEDDEEGETLNFDTSFFDTETANEVLNLTDDFFTDETDDSETLSKDESVNNFTTDNDNFVGDIIDAGTKAVAGAAGIAASSVIAAAGAEAASGALASAEAISLAAIAGNEIPQIEEEPVSESFENNFDENITEEEIPIELPTEEISTEISDEETTEEISPQDSTAADEIVFDESEEPSENIDTDLGEDLIVDETSADTADLGDLVETFDDFPLETETTIGFDELETTLDVSHETVEDEEITSSFEDLSSVKSEAFEPENIEHTEEFTDFDSITEIPAETGIRENNEINDLETLTQMPEAAAEIPDSLSVQQDIAAETVDFTDINSMDSVSEIPAEISSHTEYSEDLRDLPALETSDSEQDFSYTGEDENNYDEAAQLADDDNQDLSSQADNIFEEETNDETSVSDENFSVNDTSAEESENQQIQDEYGIKDDKDWSSDNEYSEISSENNEVANDDFSFESFSDEPEITDEEIPEQINQEASENSAAISNLEFNPGEIPIDINNSEFNYQEAEHLESIYNESDNFQNSALNNSARFVRGGNASQNGSSKLFAIVAGLLVIALLSVLGMSALNMFKPTAQEEPQPVADNQFPEIPQSVEQTEAPAVDTSKVVTMNNTNPAPSAQPAVASQASNSAVSNKIPATSFLEISKLSWEVPDYISANANFKRYFQSAGKSLKAGLSSDLLLAKDYIYSKQMRLSVTFNQNGTFKESRMLMSSGSTQIDKIVLQSVNQTLSVLKAPNSLGNDQSTTVILKIYF